jgi:hypothetical protein
MSTGEKDPLWLEHIVSTLSLDRLAPYFQATQGSHEGALELYKWNIEISGAFYEALSIAEVGLRNALHTQLTTFHGARPDYWYDNQQGLFNGGALSDISLARKRASRSGRVETPGRVVAELNFGFWKYILAKRYETTLWTPCLRHGFPGLANQHRTVVFDAVAELHSLRNRIAHHEPIYNRDLTQDLLATYRLIEWVSPETREWAVSFSRIQKCLLAAPDFIQN